jgi:uncharacterized protein
MFDAQIVRMGNWLTRRRRIRVRPEELLLLLPHCLQWNECPHNVVGKLENCRRCGKCAIRDLVELAGRRGVQCAIVSGGRQAVARVRQSEVKAILAVACEKELREGIFAVFPKPVLGVVNLRPHGPCVNTSVAVSEVDAAIGELLETFAPDAGQDESP